MHLHGGVGFRRNIFNAPSYLFYYSLRWHVSHGWQYHPGSLMWAMLRYIMRILFSYTTTFKYIAMEKHKWILNAKRQKLCTLALAWVGLQQQRHFEYSGCSNDGNVCTANDITSQHRGSQWSTEWVSVNHKFVSYTSSAKLSIPRKFVSVLWKWTHLQKCMSLCYNVIFGLL